MATGSQQGEEEPSPLEGIRAAASAPAKCILLGEHAVVYGEPCLSVALARRTRVVAHRVGDKFTVDGYPLTKRHHAFIASALERAWNGEAVRFEVDSRVPSASGIGSSAALSVATVGALNRLRSDWSPATIAQQAFEAERTAQGSGSPNDTSVSTAGGAVLLAPEETREGGIEPLWKIEARNRDWWIHRAPPARFDQEAQWVVAHTGVHAVTRRQVEKARRFVTKSGFGKDTVRALGALVWQGLDAVREEDPEAFGRTMDQAHAHLVTMGVSHPELERLVETARRTPGTYGAKLTGAGGGGALVVLTRHAQQAAAALRKAGARTFLLKTTQSGVRRETDDAPPTEAGNPSAAARGPTGGTAA